MIRRFALVILAPLLCAAQPCDIAGGHARHAFVIANSKYSALPAAPTALEDARLVSTALSGAGFTVTDVENAAMPDLFSNRQKLFLQKIQPGDVVFFYFSGHVVQGPNDDSFILPVNFDPSKDLAQQVFSLKAFLGALNDRKPGVTMTMIEGPHRIGIAIRGADQPGLIQPDPLEFPDLGKILFATSAQKGQMASRTPNLPVDHFTKAFAQHLKTPGLTLSQIFQQAKQDVYAATNKLQLPDLQEIASTGFCFSVPPVTKVEPPTIVRNVVVMQTAHTNRKDREEYVLVPSGTFKMGCVPTDTKCKDDERPQHEVTITNSFWMGRNEVEVGAFKRFWTETTKQKSFSRQAPMQDYKKWSIDNLPMVRVTWEEARDYCGWIGGRLPTEAEWELAARAGAADEVYPLNSENSRDKANFSGQHGNDIFEGVAPVKKFDPNKYDLYDMSGNVWEWVADWYNPDYYLKSPKVDPKGPETGREHIRRGGSAESDWRDHLRLSLRFHLKQEEDFKTGFRCVLDDTPATKEKLGIQ